MKRTLTMITAAVFAGALALPAFAQVGAGVAGNGTVGMSNNAFGANSDVSNGDAERTEPNAPIGFTSTTRRNEHSSMQPKTVPSESNSGVGVNAGGGSGLGKADANAAVGTNTGTDNSPTGGY
jgi:hypothetical protein